MKRALKWVAVILGVVVLVHVILAVIVIREMPEIGPPRIEAAPNVVGVLEDVAYAWIVRTSSGAVLIDAGNTTKAPAILAELKAQGLGPDAVHTILLTHAHKDHWAGAQVFPNARVIAGPGDGAVLRGERRAVPWLVEKLFMPVLPVPKNIEELKGDDTLRIEGLEIHAYHMPGHTAGSTMYLLGDLLFTGDSLMRKKGGELAGGPTLFNEDSDQSKRSLARLKDIPFAHIADGHAGLTRDARTKALAAAGP